MSDHILVVEDETETAAFITEYLCSLGYDATPAYDGQAALDDMRAARPALAVIDLMLPGMGGWELVRTMRADRDLQRVPILIVTARQEARLPADTVQGIIFKPFELSDIGQQVRALIAGAAQPH